jgi:hypothetical protein
MTQEKRSEYLPPCHSVVPKAQRALAERSGAEESHKRSPIDPWDPSTTLRMTEKKAQDDKGWKKALRRQMGV